MTTTFLPGKHRYNVGTFEHLIVRSNWFRNENINTAMFNILNQSHPKKKLMIYYIILISMGQD